jgi:hypothetical protein
LAPVFKGEWINNLGSHLRIEEIAPENTFKGKYKTALGYLQYLSTWF